MSRLWLVSSIISATLLIVSLCAEKGKFKDRTFVAGMVAMAVDYIAWIFV